ncbi:MAG: hypothetical protein AAB772_03110 [Patescibacteria group bacterium]
MKKFLLLLVFAVVILSYSAISAATTKPDPLYNIYQKLKIGIKRPKIDDIVGKYYPGHMARIAYERNGYETWHWDWPPEDAKKNNSSETAYLGIEFKDDKVSDAFYKYVSKSEVKIKRLYKPK